MANGDNKTPTWQYVAGVLMSFLMLVTSFLSYEIWSDVKEGRKIDAALDLRITSIEKTTPLQFDGIKEWMEEIRHNIELIASSQRYNDARAMKRSETIIEGQKSAAKVKDWNKIKP